jgi:predicted transposase YdaD
MHINLKEKVNQLGDWDKSLKTLVASDPQAFAEWILGEMEMETGGVKVIAQLNTEFQGYSLDADALLLVTLADEEEALIHIEFQSTADENMPDRLLDYCRRAREKYGSRPIISSVIYLRDVGKVPQPPYCWSLKSGRKLMAFDYLSIKLHEAAASKLIDLHQPAILPLTLLTKGGASRTIVTEVFNELLENGLNNLLPAAHLLANLAFHDNRANLDWLEREYRRMTVNFKDLPAYHWMTDDARNEGIEQGIERGIEQGRKQEREEELARLRQAISAIIAKGFPSISKLAQKQLALIQHPAPLIKLLTNIYGVQSVDEVKRYLNEALEESLEID